MSLIGASLLRGTAVLIAVTVFGCGGVVSPTSAPRDAAQEPSESPRDAAGPAPIKSMDAGAFSLDAGSDPDAGPVDDLGPRGDPDGSIAIPVTTFLDSIGVGIHVGQGVDNPLKSADAMKYAGIRNFRDDGRPGAVPGWISMHERAGVRGCILTNQDVASTLDMGKQLHAVGALLAIEGPNEPNNFPVTYNGKKSDAQVTFMPVAQLQRDLYAAVKADPVLSTYPVFHSSEAGGSEPDNVGLQFLVIPTGAKTLMPDGTKYADYANVHNYVCGHKALLVDNVAWNASDATLNGDWDGMYVEYGLTWGRKFTGYTLEQLPTLPRVSTETGWVTTGKGAITQEQQARVFLDLYLSSFKQGFSYTFIYMLRDDPGQGYWGLFDTEYAPKVSGEYLHRFTTLLGDARARAPGKLDYQLITSAVTVHDLLLQKSDGTFQLVVWDEHFSGGSDDVTVRFGLVRDSVQIFDPTTGLAPVQSLKRVQNVDLKLTDHPVVIEVPF